MSVIDHSDIDGRLLQVLLAVFEEQSVTRAATRLDVTQSAVSHQLDRLRTITGDALFVKSGRGIVPTVRAEALALHARRLLDELRAFAQGASFDRFIDERGIRRRVAIIVAGFSGVAPFLRGSDFLATLPGLLRASLLRGFATAAPPFPCPPNPMFMVWHQRHQADPMHRWLHEELLAIVAPALAAAELPAPRRA